METYIELIKSSSGGEEIMWNAVDNLSKHLEKLKEAHPQMYEDLMYEQYAILNNGHFNKKYALKKVSEMHHIDKSGRDVVGENWTIEQTDTVYELLKNELTSEPNKYDWYVMMNMKWHDNICLLKEWFENKTDDLYLEKIIDLSRSWYNDPDRPYKNIWNYLF